MNNKTLTITAAVLTVMVIMAAVGFGCTKKAIEEPIAETEKIEIVQETAPEAKEGKTDARNIKIYSDCSTVANSNNSGADRSDNNHLHSAGCDNGDDQEPAEQETTLSAEELAHIVIDAGINGDARKAELGDRYDEVQAWIDANYEAPTYVYTEVGGDYYQPSGSGSVLNPSDGINYYGGILETYYNLDMSGVLDIMYSLGYSGDYWVRSDGVKMFGPYVMAAADFGWLPRGSVVECSLGTAMVVDTGAGGYGWLDIATCW